MKNFSSILVVSIGFMLFDIGCMLTDKKIADKITALGCSVIVCGFANIK